MSAVFVLPDWNVSELLMLMNDIINISNVLTMNGTLRLGTNGAVTALVAGDAFKLFNAGSYSGSFTTVTPSPGPGLVWDTSALAVSVTLLP